MSPSASEQPAVVPPALRNLGGHWGLVLAYGLLTVGLGIVLAVWPGETLLVVAVMIAIQLLVAGLLRLVGAITATAVDGGVRALYGLIGALAIIAGLLCLREPIRSLVAIGLILGVWWVVQGLMDIIGALTSFDSVRRVWDVVMGVVSVLAGGFLLVNPELSLGVLVVVICVWLFAHGLLTIVLAFQLRSVREAGVASPGPAATAT